jgi:RHS repeat-associated protein
MQAGTGPGAYDSNYTNINVYFAGKLVWREYSNGMWGGVAVDRLGSVVGDNWAAHSYFPFGEEKVTTSQNLVKFATYYRDATTALDYANQRYYGRTFGRCLTVDPYGSSANPSDPQSWNRYSYVQNDPVNFNDPSGLFIQAPSGDPPDPVPSGWAPDWNPDFWRPAVQRQIHAQEIAQEWNMLTDKWRQGLHDAMPGSDFNTATLELRLNALARAGAQTGVLAHAAGLHGIDWAMLAAIGIRESKFNPSAKEILKDGSIGGGRGAFQIDININKGVSEANAMNLEWAADWAANSLADNYAILAAKYPNFDASHLLQATAASYNFGTDNISGNPDTIDKKSTGDNYGSNILDLMDCFH